MSQNSASQLLLAPRPLSRHARRAALACLIILPLLLLPSLLLGQPGVNGGWGSRSLLLLIGPAAIGGTLALYALLLYLLDKLTLDGLRNGLFMLLTLLASVLLVLEASFWFALLFSH